MRGLSAEGLVQAEERVESLAASGDAQQLGTELFAIAAVLGTQGSLRRAMTDPSASAEARRGLATTVFSGKVSDVTVEALATAAAARWSSPSDFVNAVEQLGVLALVIEAEKNGQLSELEDELFRFGRVVSSDPVLRDAITNKQIPLAARQGLVGGLLEGKASTPAIALATQAVASRHHSFEMALEDFERAAAQRQQRLVAVVRSAVELSDDERGRLARALGHQYGRDITINVVVDPQVLGGIRVELGDDVIDGTVEGRLDDARRRMAG